MNLLDGFLALAGMYLVAVAYYFYRRGRQVELRSTDIDEAAGRSRVARHPRTVRLTAREMVVAYRSVEQPPESRQFADEVAAVSGSTAARGPNVLVIKTSRLQAEDEKADLLIAASKHSLREARSVVPEAA